MAKTRAFEFISPENWRFLNNAEVAATRLKAEELSKRQFDFANLEAHCEEYLRQWILRELIEIYQYPEDWLWIGGDVKRNANVLIKNEANQTLALVAARYFGETDLEFEKACQDLQSDLEEIGSVQFGLVTDGKRIAFLSKPQTDSIADYQAIEDFPSFAELKAFGETGQFPQIPLAAMQFKVLPAQKAPVKAAAPIKQIPAVAQAKKSTLNLPESAFPPVKKSRSNAGVWLCLVALVIGAGFVWHYLNRSSAQTPVAADSKSENKLPETKTSDLKTISPGILPDKTGGAQKVQAPQVNHSKSARSSTKPTQYNDDGSIKLSREDDSLMRGSGMSNPSLKAPAPKTANQTKQSKPDNRVIIAHP